VNNRFRKRMQRIKMAALNRPTNATYETHENVTIDTQDNEDHTFCGIMFPIKCKDLLPVDHLVVKSVAVRGRLGPLTVWVNKKDENYSGDLNRRYCTRSIRNKLAHRVLKQGEGGHISKIEHRIPLDPSSWIKLYDKKHDPCPPGQYTELVFNEPFCLRPGEMRAIYIHSTLPGDTAIVYDNSYYGTSDKRFEDDKLSILTGRAHVSTTCFGQDPIWGWGNAWRDRREFVGRLEYGTVYKLWNPEVQPKFGSCFQNGARVLLMCQRRSVSPVSMLPDEAIFYILNMCRWDWFNDSSNGMNDRRKREKLRNQLLFMEQEEQEQQEMKSASSVAGHPMNEGDEEDAKPSANSMTPARHSCNQPPLSAGVVNNGNTTGLSDSDEEDDEYVDMSDGGDKDDDDVADDGDDEDITMNSADGESESDDSSEDVDEYHRANRRYFSFQYPGSDDEETEKSTSSSLKNNWFRHQFARVHVLRALASMEDQAISQF